MDSGLRQEDIAFWLSDQLTALEGGYGQRQRRWIRQPHILASNPFKASGSYFWKYNFLLSVLWSRTFLLECSRLKSSGSGLLMCDLGVLSSEVAKLQFS